LCWYIDRQTDTTSLRNFRIYRSRYRNIQKLDYKTQTPSHNTPSVSSSLFYTQYRYL
jgi:hypothetical protein